MRRFAGEAVIIMRALKTHGQAKSERAEPTEQAAYGEQTASNEAETDDSERRVKNKDKNKNQKKKETRRVQVRR
jgi:hypothetical protein